jgi:hypothetical protein
VHNLQLTIPAQDGERASVRIKPREVRSWLDNLPFLDLERTARLARKQLRLMNRQAIPAGARLAMLGDFLAAYQRLTEALGGQARDNDALHTLVKRLCQDIGFGYKIVTHELVNKRSGFMETRNLPLALLGAIHTLGLQLLDCYAGYQRAPRALWSECLALYAYAWQNGREQYSAPLPGFGAQQIDACFRLIALLRLADPYRLPASMVGPLRSYFAQRIDLCAIHSEPPPDSNCFQLKDAFQQSPMDQDPHLYLDLDQLLATMKTDVARLAQYRQPQAIGLPPEIPAQALLRSLRQTLDHWQHHPTRSAEREETHARIDLVSGLNAAYCMVNHGRCFDPSLFVLPGQDQVIDLGAHPAPDHDRSAGNLPVPFTCTGINRSSGGLAVRYRGPQAPHPRVGQIVALRRPSPQSSAGWVVAVCRWLVEPEGDNGFELGLQYLAREPRAVVVRVTDDRGQLGDYQAAITATQKRGEQRVQTLITRGGEILTGSLVAIFEQGRQQQVRCSEQLECGPGFDRFIYVPV